MAIQSPHFILDNKGNISVTRANDVTFTLTFTNELNQAIDLTGATVYLTVRKNQDVGDLADSEAIIAQQYTSISNPTAGIVTITITRTELIQTVGEYYYDIDIKQANNDVLTVLKGVFTITYKSANRTS